MSDETPRQEFNKALLAAQKEFPTIHKGKTARIPTKNDGEYSYKYADLGDVMDAVLPILHKHDLALTQPLVFTENGKVGVGTRIYHSSGHVEDFGELTLPAGNNPQAAGSAITYARRYAACAALGIVADEDDDGQAASRPEPQVPQVDLADVIKTKVAVFKEWSEDERRDLFKTHSRKMLDGRPQTPDDVDRVVDSMAEQYYEQFPSSDEVPF